MLCWLSGNVGRAQLTAVDSVPAAAAVGRMYESAVCCLRPPYNHLSQCGHSFSFISPDTDIAAGYKNFTAVFLLYTKAFILRPQARSCLLYFNRIVAINGGVAAC